MARGRKQAGPKGLSPPGPAGVGNRRQQSGRKDFGGYKAQDVGEFAAHASEVRDITAGRDFVEAPAVNPEKRPAPFDRQQLEVVRAWVKSRPLEPNNPASARIAYPRMWTTKRGRYTKFKLPGAGIYGIVRSRPTF